MTMEEFRIETKTMEDFYNKELNYTQMQVWHNELKFYNTERYKNAISKVLRTQSTFPSLNTMLDIISKCSSNEIVKEKVPCNLCKGTGYITYKKIVNDVSYEYACLCTCDNAKGLNYDGLHADKEHKSNYYIPTAEKIFSNMTY